MRVHNVALWLIVVVSFRWCRGSRHVVVVVVVVVGINDGGLCDVNTGGWIEPLCQWR